MAQMTFSRTHVSAEPLKQEIEVRSIFRAPREIVFEAYTNPDLVPKYWGPAALTTKVEKMDVRQGGEWRFVQKDAEGKEYAFRGVYHDIVPSARLIYTFQWEELPGHVALETVTLKDLDGDTEVIDQLVFQSVEDRDGMYNSGMEQGIRESHERFAKLVEKA